MRARSEEETRSYTPASFLNEHDWWEDDSHLGEQREKPTHPLPHLKAEKCKIPPTSSFLPLFFSFDSWKRKENIPFLPD